MINKEQYCEIYTEFHAKVKKIRYTAHTARNIAKTCDKIIERDWDDGRGTPQQTLQFQMIDVIY